MRVHRSNSLQVSMQTHNSGSESTSGCFFLCTYISHFCFLFYHIVHDILPVLLIFILPPSMIFYQYFWFLFYHTAHDIIPLLLIFILPHSPLFYHTAHDMLPVLPSIITTKPRRRQTRTMEFIIDSQWIYNSKVHWSLRILL